MVSALYLRSLCILHILNVLLDILQAFPWGLPEKLLWNGV